MGRASPVIRVLAGSSRTKPRPRTTPWGPPSSTAAGPDRVARGPPRSAAATAVRCRWTAPPRTAYTPRNSRVKRSEARSASVRPAPSSGTHCHRASTPSCCSAVSARLAGRCMSGSLPSTRTGNAAGRCGLVDTQTAVTEVCVPVAALPESARHPQETRPSGMDLPADCPPTPDPADHPARTPPIGELLAADSPTTRPPHHPAGENPAHPRLSRPAPSGSPRLAG